MLCHLNTQHLILLTRPDKKNGDGLPPSLGFARFIAGSNFESVARSPFHLPFRHVSRSCMRRSPCLAGLHGTRALAALGPEEG